MNFKMFVLGLLLWVGLLAHNCEAFLRQTSPCIRPKTVVQGETIRQKNSMRMVGPVAWAGALPIMYSLMSLNEYVTHRFYQHGPPAFDQKYLGGRNIHIEHHAETLDDMSLKTDEFWMNSPAAKRLEGNKYRGTAFTYRVTALMLLQMIPSTIPVYLSMGFSIFQTFSILIPCLILHASVWNTIHPSMHGLQDVPVSVGIPSAWLNRFKNSWFFKFLYQNHEGHHVLGGQCNYNVCCPGADFIFGTYVKEIDWRPKMKSVDPRRQTSKSSNVVPS